jgi:hypothetical protein
MTPEPGAGEIANSAHNFHPLLSRSPEIQLKLLEVLADRLARTPA